MANPMANLTIGVDLGDRYSELYVVDAAGACVETGRIRTTVAGLEQWFGGRPPARVVLEAGTHSPWASRVLPQLGHEVLVANPRKLRGLYENDSKDDRVDAEYLARVGRLDPALLKPITHRGEAAQADLAVLSSRDVLVRARTLLINHTRGVVKALGGRLPRCSAEAFARRVGPHVPPALRPALAPVLEQLQQLTTTIRGFDRAVEHRCAQSYPETARLRQVTGVGPVTALAYVVVLDDPTRFRRRGGRLSRPAAAAQPVGRAGPAAPDHEGGQSLLAPAGGAGGALHPRPAWAGLRPAAARGTDCRARRQECEEAGRDRRGPEAGGAAAPSLDQWRGVRAAAPPPGAGAGELRK